MNYQTWGLNIMLCMIFGLCQWSEIWNISSIGVRHIHFIPMQQRRGFQPELPDVEDKSDVAKHRLRVAKEDLQAACLLLEANSYRGANNRSYYAIFHAVSAVLAMEGVAFKKHKDTLAYFNKNYVANVLKSRMMSCWIIQNLMKLL